MAGAAGEPPQKREEWGDYRENGARGIRGRGRGEATQMASGHGISSHYSRVCRLSGLRARGMFCSGQLIQASYRTGKETWLWCGKSSAMVQYGAKRLIGTESYEGNPLATLL